MDISINKEGVYKYLGYQKDKHILTKSIDELVDECIDEVLKTITPRMIYTKKLNIVRNEDSLNVEKMQLIGSDIKEHLAHCDKTILMAVTLGNQMDDLIRKTEIIDMTKAVIFDAVSNVAIEEVANICEDNIRYNIEKDDEYLTGRYSPGYGDMPLDSQRDLLEIVDAARKIGITLTANNIMIPRKSITAVLGVAPLPVVGKKAGCNHCVMKDKCIYRQRGTTCDK